MICHPFHSSGLILCLIFNGLTPLQPSWRVPDLEEAFPEGLGGAYCLMLTMVFSALTREKGEAIKQLLVGKVRQEWAMRKTGLALNGLH